MHARVCVRLFPSAENILRDKLFFFVRTRRWGTELVPVLCFFYRIFLVCNALSLLTIQ